MIDRKSEKKREKKNCPIVARNHCVVATIYHGVKIWGIYQQENLNCKSCLLHRKSEQTPILQDGKETLQVLRGRMLRNPSLI